MPQASFIEWFSAENRVKLFSVTGACNSTRIRCTGYPEVEASLVKYIELRRQLYNRDKCGLSFLILKERANQIAKKELSADRYKSFKSSNGWLSKVLERNNFVGIKLHGEGNKISEEEATNAMTKFRANLSDIMQKHGVLLGRIYNADQTGLYYQKFLNHIYCKEEERQLIRGVKLMKDKTRLTLMACTSATGEKIKLAVIGKSNRPHCWDICDDHPPLPYNHQSNAWFDRSITEWWLNDIFAPECRKKHGENKVILLLDNFPAHVGINDASIPKNVILMFFPPSLTARHQPADQGMIACVKLGYKLKLLQNVLQICDD